MIFEVYMIFEGAKMR